MFLIQGQPIFQAQRTDTIVNPCLIIEVLSKSTNAYDRTDQFRYYRSISDFREYVLINQYEAEIEQYKRSEEDLWLFRAYESDAKTIKFASIDVEMTVEEIYENVDFNIIDSEA